MGFDFVKIITKKTEKRTTVTPTFYHGSSDIIVMGQDMQYFWDDETKYWVKGKNELFTRIDNLTLAYCNENGIDAYNGAVKVMWMREHQSKLAGEFKNYLNTTEQREVMPYMNDKVIFKSQERTKEMYATTSLTYDPDSNVSIECYDKLVGTLYDPDNRHKLEWLMGCVLRGDNLKVHKCAVIYGSPGEGKTTILDVIGAVFQEYAANINLTKIVSAENFASGQIENNPLVLLDSECSLRKMADNQTFNQMVSHEKVMVNQKFKQAYNKEVHGIIFAATNDVVQFTSPKAGILRRLIDVYPTGVKLPFEEYWYCMQQIPHEVAGIAAHCMAVYDADPKFYLDYFPSDMYMRSNRLAQFFVEHRHQFDANEVTGSFLFGLYEKHCNDSKQHYFMDKTDFLIAAESFFKTRTMDEHGGVRFQGFVMPVRQPKKVPGEAIEKYFPPWLILTEQPSLFDREYDSCLAQYADIERNSPTMTWDNVRSYLRDISTDKLHYVLLNDPQHIVVDFDLKNTDGEKDLALNLEAAKAYPPTYAEVSKSGGGLHLHYIYKGNVDELARAESVGIEIKVFKGKASLRRKLTLCNSLGVAVIGDGALRKKEKTNNMITFSDMRSEQQLRKFIHNCLAKTHHGATYPEMSFMKKVMDEAYEKGFPYDVRDLQSKVFTFASSSTNQADNCMRIAAVLPWTSASRAEETDICEDTRIKFFDIEVFPNLFLINWKYRGKENPVVRMINPTKEDVQEFMQGRLVGFNNRRYDNHIVYYASIGYAVPELYKMSQKIINNDPNGHHSEAWNLSYTDIYDFASAGNKKSLKKLEFEMGFHHEELGLPWDQPVPEDMFEKVAAYCDNDVLATEAAFEYLQSDWSTRQILAGIAGLSVNSSTNKLTTRIIFGDNKEPQNEFFYRKLSEPIYDLPVDVGEFLRRRKPKMFEQTHGEAKSILPYFPGYTFDRGKSVYKDIEVGEGGYVYAEPGEHRNVALLDVASMHPNSLISECFFGPHYTEEFARIVDARVDIKHKEFDMARDMFNGKLVPYIEKVEAGEMKAKELANALKTPINSVYGLTAAKFENAFRLKENIDNIVAKRGALFMVDLKEAVEAKGFTVAHIKTDSIKIPNATRDIIDFVMEFGERYGYVFEHEATYDRMCLINDAVYIAKFLGEEECQNLYGYVPDKNQGHAGEWTATGKQFAVPYTFKTLFSNEDLAFEDFCEQKEVKTALYLDMNENLPEGEHAYSFVGRVGVFVPIKPGCNGGDLLREKDGKYHYATGASGWRWVEAESIRNGLYSINDIDTRYFDKLVDDAEAAIAKYTDPNEFIHG